MSLQGLNYFRENWTLNNSLTINANVEVQGDLNTTGFIYDGGVPVSIQSDNNVWTGNNTFSNFAPTFLYPVADLQMANKQYVDDEVVGLGDALLPLNNTFTGVNTLSALPTIAVNAVNVADALNKTTADSIINTSTGALATNNLWTGTNTFNNVVNVPTPLVDGAFANKKYVDDAVTAFNTSGGKIEYFEYDDTDQVNLITCDPVIYSSMIVCLVAGGGFGSDGTGGGVAGTSFGGAGAMCAFKIPAFTSDGNTSARINFLSSVKGGVRGYAQFVTDGGTAGDEGTILVQVNSGADGTTISSGAGGTATIAAGVSGIQIINGSSEPFQPTSATPAITRSYNIGCLNGFGCGGSQIIGQPEVLPTGNYALVVKFRN
jgi:hypothetical protein